MPLAGPEDLWELDMGSGQPLRGVSGRRMTPSRVPPAPVPGSAGSLQGPAASSRVAGAGVLLARVGRTGSSYEAWGKGGPQSFLSCS